MWFPLTLLLLVGVAVATNTHEHGWNTEEQYQYLVQSRTVAGLDRLKAQYTGVQLKGILTIQAKSPNTLLAKFSNPQSTRIHTILQDGPDTEISDQMLKYHKIPMSQKPFMIKVKHGVIRDILIHPEVPTWEVNIVKGIVSQLQIDTQGENAIATHDMQIPNENQPFGLFKAMEDSVGGKCEVQYEIVPLPNEINYYNSTMIDKVPFPHLRDDGRHYDVKKIKNYNKCKQQQLYHYGVKNPTKLARNEKDDLLSQISTSHMIISGKLTRFAIQSAVTKNQIFVKPGKADPFLGTVHSTTRLNLIRVNKIDDEGMLQVDDNLVSTGNLVYTYNSPFSDSQHRKPRPPSVSRNSEQVKSSESSSSSSESSSSSSSSSEETDPSSFQPTSTLKQPPNIPLLPFFVGNQGKNIQTSDKGRNIVDRVQDIISQIANEMQSPYQMQIQDTLEKYTILQRIIRTMDQKQYAELENRIPRSHDEEHQSSANQHPETNAWDVLRDAVVQAGTGPAFVTVANWIKNGKIEGAQAARIISQIPKNVRTPTPEYVKAFYELITEPAVQQQRYVNVSAPIAFGELICNNNRRQRYYPIRSFGRMTSKNNKEVEERYIPHLANRLKQAIDENDSAKIQTYIVALGVTGHPKILSVYEPYLEGKQPASKFQRVLMVSSLSTLAATHPKLAGPVLYKIYLNIRDAHELRCMAVHQFIKTDPPVVMLQRIAKFTQYDTNNHVNSAVKTTLNSIANSRRPEWQNLANKIRSVRNLLNSQKYSHWDSLGYYGDLDNSFVDGFNYQTIVSDDNPIASYARFGLNTIFDHLGKPTVEAGYVVSSIKQLFSNILGNERTSQDMQKSRVEKIAQVLKIKPQNVDRLEGNVFVDSIYGAFFYPIDRQALQNAAQRLKEFWAKNLYTYHSTVFSNSEMTVSFPTENGLPFLYTVESPMVVKVAGKKEKSSEQATKRSGKINALVVNKVQSRFGFITPFDHQEFIAGIDNNRQVQVPVGIETDQNERNVAMKLNWNMPKSEEDSQVRLLHLSTVPFTAQQDILNLQPVSVDKNTHHVTASRKQRTEVRNGPFSVELETDNEETQEHNLVDQLKKLVKSPQESNDGLYKKLDVSVNAEELAQSKMSVNVVYDQMVIENANNEEPDADWQNIPIAQEPNSNDRRRQIMKNLSKGLRSGSVHVLDIDYDVPLSQEEIQVVSIGVTKSNVDRKSKAFVYWNSQSAETQKVNKEACYHQVMQYSATTPLNVERALENTPKDDFKGQLRYGKSCKEGTVVNIAGKAVRSNQMNQMLQNSRTVKQCQQQIKQGNKAAPCCQEAIQLAEVKNQFDFSIEAPRVVRNIINRLIEYLMEVIASDTTQINVVNPKNSETNTIDIKMVVSPVDAHPKVTVHTPEMDVIFSNPKNRVGTQQQNSLLERETTTGNNQIFTNEKRRASCVLDKHQVVTFDDVVYPVTLGQCKHVLMTTYPQQDPDQDNELKTIPEESRVAVLAEETEDGSRHVTMLLGDQEVKLQKSGDRLEATVDGQSVKISQHNSYQNRDAKTGKTILEISKLTDESIKLTSDKYNIGAVYDGERLQLWASDKYRNAVRGLCGNYDTQSDNDLVSPKNCIVRKPEEFAATYAMTQESCRGPAVENKQKAEQAECERPQSIHSNVINDREAGRSTEGESWGYHQHNQKAKKNQNRKLNRNNQNEDRAENEEPNHFNNQYDQETNRQDRDRFNSPSQEIEDNNRYNQEKHNFAYRTKVFEEGEEICFTTRPVPACPEGTRPVERRVKNFQLHCKPTNAESIAQKRRVEQGANPDFTRKSVSKTHTFQIPVACVAA